MGVKERREREEAARLEAIVAAAERVFIGPRLFSRPDGRHRRGGRAGQGHDLLLLQEQGRDLRPSSWSGRPARSTPRSCAGWPARSTLLGLLELWIDFYLEYFEKNQGYLRMFLPCMGGMIRFEDEEAGRKLLRNAEQWRELREALEVQDRPASGFPSSWTRS